MCNLVVVEQKVEQKVLVEALSHFVVGVSGCWCSEKDSVTLNGTGPL